MTQLKQAKNGKITEQMRIVAKAEEMTPEAVRELIKSGKAVIPSNSGIDIKKKTCGIGLGMKTKVNANIGTSQDYCSIKDELKKAETAINAGADAIMDLSSSGNIKKTRRAIIAISTVPVGTVPIYEAVVNADTKKGKTIVSSLTEEAIFDTVVSHAKDGVDFITVHSGINSALVAGLDGHPRVGGVVSRGGTILVEWMKAHGKENPFYKRFDDLLDIARQYDMTLSLGDGMRPGATADSLDWAQIEELKNLADLARRARKADVQVMIEGPGHVPLHQVQAQVTLQKAMCDGAPFYVLGPLVTDVAPGYDHITSAIGGALAAWAGADMICYVTPMEHLGLPQAEHVKEGVIAARIAGHAADIAKGIPSAIAWDRRFSEYRKNRDWDNQIAHCIDPDRARKFRKSRKPSKESACSMCGKLCVYALSHGEKE